MYICRNFNVNQLCRVATRYRLESVIVLSAARFSRHIKCIIIVGMPLSMFFFLFAKEYAACHTLKFSEFIALAYMQITVNNNNIYNPINGKKQRFWRQFTHGTYSFTNEHNSCAVACALLLHFATPQLSSAACCSIADK